MPEKYYVGSNLYIHVTFRLAGKLQDVASHTESTPTTKRAHYRIYARTRAWQH